MKSLSLKVGSVLPDISLSEAGERRKLDLIN